MMIKLRRMSETEFINALEKTALDLGYTVARKDYTDLKDTYTFQVFHTMKLPTHKNEILGIIKTFTDCDTECWKFTFNKDDHPDWTSVGIRFNYKYLEIFKKYLIEFSKNYKQYLEWQYLKDLKEDF